MNDLRQTKEFARYLKSRGWMIEKMGKTFVFIRKIPLTPFSIIKVQRPEKIDFKKINQFAKKYHALATYIEPKSLEIERNDFHFSRSPFLPTKTIHLNLTQSEKTLLSQMKKDARYSIKKAEKSCRVLELQSDKDKNMVIFHHVWKMSVSWRRHVPSFKSLKFLQKSFGSKAIFLIAKKKRSPILAGTVILITNTTAFYYYAFTSKEGRQKLAQYLLIWKAIKLAKKRGCKIFDFEGIYDSRFPIKTWQGFSHFKKSFGGQEIEYPGCFVKKSFLKI